MMQRSTYVLGGTMRTRTIAITAAFLLAALTACSGGSGATPTKTVTATETKTPELTDEQVTTLCVDAVAERAKAETSGEVAFVPTPEPCAPLSDSEYLDAYMDGLNEANRDALDSRG